jgi:hypothetical protein
MSVSTSTSSVNYTGNASTSAPYVVNFPFFDATDLTVYVTTASGVVSTLTPSQFSVTGGAGSNGNVVTTAAVPATSTVTITRNVPYTQLTSYTTGDRFPASTHEKALDKITMGLQQLDRKSVPDPQTASGAAPYVLGVGSVGGSPAWVPQTAAPIADGAITAAKIAPITATGSTTARAIADRFADVVNVKDFGAVGDGVTDDTVAIQAALGTTSTAIYFPAGAYRISASGSTAALSSTVSGRRIFGEGVITATTPVRKAISITGARTELTLDCNGNSNIAVFAHVSAIDCFIHHCTIRNLYASSGFGEVNGIRVTLNGLQGGGVISDNVFLNLESVGDAIGGNASGFTRAILIEADSNQAAPIVVANNRIDTVVGEEGDAIAVINSNGAGTYYELNLCIQGNSIFNFNRRGVKIQCSGANILNNIFQNSWGSAPSQIQGVIDLVQGGKHVIRGNELTNCKFCSQIKALEDVAPINDIFIVDNVISGIGSETVNTLIALDMKLGANAVVSNNTILASLFGETCIRVANANTVIVDRNTVINANGTSFDLSTNLSNLILGNNSFSRSRSASFRADGVFSQDAFSVEVLGTANRSLTLYNSDSTISDGELISQICFHQNDNGSNQVNASIRAIAAGTTGVTKLVFCAGTNSPWFEVGHSGAITPSVDNTQSLGNSTLRWSTVFAGTGTINTSDEREKQQIESIDHAVLSAWKKVNFKQFKFNDAVEKKGDAARLHFGVIAQQVKEAFESEGLDAFDYGLLCYDEWEAKDEIKDDEGNVIQPAVAAGNRYGVRYEEALALECAYQRIVTESLLERIEALESN